MIPAIENYQGLNITFQVTEACNLRCKYCYEVNKKPTTLPLEYAQKFIDIILTDPDPINIKGTAEDWILTQGLIMDFIGGDALMVPELCDQIIQYFQYRAYQLGHRWANQWRASISTNGTLFDNPGVKEFLNKYRENISVGVSIDGCPEIHDKNRIFADGSGTIEKIQKDWAWYLQYAGNAANTKATLNKESIPYLYESVKFLHEEMKLRYINMNFIFEEEGRTEKDYQKTEEQLALVVDYVLEHCDELHLSLLDESFGIGNPTTEEQLKKSWCGSGAMPTLSVNGKIYPCFRFTPSTMQKEEYDMSVGDIWQGLNKKENLTLIRAQTRKKISPQKCLECPIESSCAWCVGAAYAESGKFYRQTNICRMKQIIDKWSRIYWNKYYEKKGQEKRYEAVIHQA